MVVGIIMIITRRSPKLRMVMINCAATNGTFRSSSIPCTTIQSHLLRGGYPTSSRGIVVNSTNSRNTTPSSFLFYNYKNNTTSTAAAAAGGSCRQTTTSFSPIRKLSLSSSFYYGMMRGPILQQQQHHQQHKIDFLLYHPMYHQLGTMTYFSSWFGGNNNNNHHHRMNPNTRRSRVAQGISLLGIGTVLFGKTKYFIMAMKITKLSTLGSMIFSIGTYSMFFGLPYAMGMVGLVFIHELGHAMVMYQRNIPFSPMVFLPFMGAMITMNRQPRDAWEDALVAFGGPILGSVGAGAVAIAAHTTNSQLLYALADFGFMINLFNMLPLGSMDGGRITGALSPYAGVVGLGFGGMLAYQGAIQNPLFYLILLSGGYETFMRFYNPDQLVPPNYYKITRIQRTALTMGYFGLITALIVAMDANEKYKKDPQMLIREKENNERNWDMRSF